MNTTTCAECGDTIEQWLEGVGYCNPCVAAMPDECESCGALSAGDSLPYRVWHAEGMLLILCDDCADITGHRVGSRRCCRGYAG